MNIAKDYRSLIASLMIAIMAATSLPIGTAYAGMISTKQIIEPTAGPEAKTGDQASSARERVLAVLAKTDVRDEMVALGVDPEEADARIAALTDQELAEIAGRLDQLPAGEGFGFGSAIIIAFVVFGAVVILDALGITDWLPFVCGPGQCVTQQATAYPQQSAYPEPAAGPTFDDYRYQEQAPAYRRERNRADPYARRREPRYETERYYQPAPAPSQRNYYEERFGTQKQFR